MIKKSQTSESWKFSYSRFPALYIYGMPLAEEFEQLENIVYKVVIDEKSTFFTYWLGRRIFDFWSALFFSLFQGLDPEWATFPFLERPSL
jgi:hypothetical protein